MLVLIPRTTIATAQMAQTIEIMYLALSISWGYGANDAVARGVCGQSRDEEDGWYRRRQEMQLKMGREALKKRLRPEM